MIRRLFFAACGIFSCAGVAQALTVEPGDAGPVYQFQKVRSSFTIVNDANVEIRGLVVKPLRPTDSVLSAPQTVAAGGNVVIDVEVDSQNDFGSRGHTFKIDYEGAKSPILGRVSLFALSVLSDPTRVLDFESVKAGESPKINYTLSTDDPAVRVVSVKEAPDFVDVKINKDGRGIVVHHRAKTTWGKLTGLVKIQLDSGSQKEAWIPVHTEVRGEVLPATTNFSLGVARIGQLNEYILQYRSEGKSFTLDKVALEGLTGKVTVQDCVGGEKFCQQVRMVVDDHQPSGQLNGILRAHVAEFDRDIVVMTGGLLISKDVKIKSLDEAFAEQAKKGDETKPVPSLNEALKSMSVAEKPIEAAIPPGDGPLLRWSVNNEELIYGYAIYRADSEQGTFSLQGDLVRKSALAKTGVMSNYAVRDKGAAAGKEYWYRIATFYNDGKREFLSAPQRVKVRAADGAAPR
ncbi:MAG TPA: hypothetical protein VLF18_13380 [Tahibacter sp.]|uniref:hypothetical protein n=1 Tax=Tahibacter sp. TaxID=2056211 RepID=UPI002C19F6DB|nr:hypothetical protein [Tahibacter sp.]HSX61187.1 hypothetical protein [Tahibacter sp.]